MGYAPGRKRFEHPTGSWRSHRMPRSIEESDLHINHLVALVATQETELARTRAELAECQRWKAVLASRLPRAYGPEEEF